MKKSIRIVVSVLFLGVAVLLIYLLIDSIQTPIDYEEQRTERFQTTVDQLIAIRVAQTAYKDNNQTKAKRIKRNAKGEVVLSAKGDTVMEDYYVNAYTPSFDTLINFINTGKLKVVKAIGTLSDAQLKAKLTEQKAVEMIKKAEKTGNWTEVEEAGLKGFRRDTIYVSVKDSLFKNLGYPVEELRYTRVGKKVEFIMDTATVMTGSGVAVKVFQCYALYDNLLDGLNRQLTINYKDKMNDSCLRVGNLLEANNNAGNWDANMENKKRE